MTILSPSTWFYHVIVSRDSINGHVSPFIGHVMQPSGHVTSVLRLEQINTYAVGVKCVIKKEC